MEEIEQTLNERASEAARALGRLRWAGKSEAEKHAHAMMMAEKSVAARKRLRRVAKKGSKAA